MSLTTQQWRYVGAANIAAATVAASLDALYSLGTAAVYADATSRTEGAGSAWTWTAKRYQNGGVTESLYPQPPTDTLNSRVLFAGQASGGVKTPTMWIDTSATVHVLVGIAKNAGAFNAWDNAAPMTSGQFSGYARTLAAANAFKVHLYECQESLVVLWEKADGTCKATIAGALIDPTSTDVVSDAESDGKLYALFTTNITTDMLTAQWTTASAGASFWHSATASASHFGVFTPGSATMLTARYLFLGEAAMTSTGLKTRSGRYGRVPIMIRWSAAAPNDGIAGRLREISYFSDSMYPLCFSSGGTKYGFTISGSNSAACDAFLLEY